MVLHEPTLMKASLWPFRRAPARNNREPRLRRQKLRHPGLLLVQESAAVLKHLAKGDMQPKAQLPITSSFLGQLPGAWGSRAIMARGTLPPMCSESDVALALGQFREGPCLLWAT